MTLVRIAAPLRTQVVALLREDIFHSTFLPGARLVERDLCERYSVSRTVVREALRQLETEGLVAMVANHGPVVAQLGRVETVELFEVRSVLEPLICKLFTVRASETDKARLRETVAAFEGGVDGSKGGDWSAPDAYYEVLLEGCGNTFLANTFRSSQARIRLTRGAAFSEPGAAQFSMKELRDVTDAVMAGDLVAVQQRSELHVQKARERVLARIDHIMEPPR